MPNLDPAGAAGCATATSGSSARPIWKSPICGYARWLRSWAWYGRCAAAELLDRAPGKGS